MSTDIRTIENTGRKGVPLQITEFWGGNEKGEMLQIGQGFGGRYSGDPDEPGFLHLTKEDASKLAYSLMEWLND